jgi:hypothetical protein
VTRREIGIGLASFVLGALAMLLVFVLMVMWHGR